MRLIDHRIPNRWRAGRYCPNGPPMASRFRRQANFARPAAAEAGVGQALPTPFTG